MNEMKNVHSYDRQLKNQYNPTKNYTNDDKKKLYTDFKDEITDPYAKDMITTMLSDALKGDKMDDMNEIDWSDLFSDILSHKGLVDMKQILEEQLRDMRMLGPCAQGRSTRLLQIWNVMDHK